MTEKDTNEKARMEENICTGEITQFVSLSNNLPNSTRNELHVCLLMYMLPRTNQSQFFPVFFSFSLTSHLSPHSLLVRAASGPSAGTDWQLCGIRGNQWHTTLHLLLVLQKDLEGGNAGRETSKGPKTGAREPGSKNKMMLCFLFSALLFFLYSSFILFCCNFFFFLF